jgi:hypothetical protein
MPPEWLRELAGEIQELTLCGLSAEAIAHQARKIG